jgi:hypothetical protein
MQLLLNSPKTPTLAEDHETRNPLGDIIVPDSAKGANHQNEDEHEPDETQMQLLLNSPKTPTLAEDHETRNPLDEIIVPDSAKGANHRNDDEHEPDENRVPDDPVVINEDELLSEMRLSSLPADLITDLDG